MLVFLHCEDENLNDKNYPKGMHINDIESANDCLLPECSSQRVVRLIANNVVGKIEESVNGDFGISYPFTFDSHIVFYLCDLPDEFRENGLEVKFDGIALDACGYHTASFPIEEVYTLKITKIKKI